MVSHCDEERRPYGRHEPKRVLVIGGDGMAGHVLLRYLAAHTSYEVFYTTEYGKSDCEYPLPGAALRLDASDSVMVDKLVEAVRPELIVNAHGIMYDAARQRELEAVRINGLFPHQLAELADRLQARLVQISTDSVFLGDRGRYEERHVPDGTTAYARTKALGEVVRAPHLTIRTSLIGPELREEGSGLLPWFLRQRGEIRGFVRVPWNGVTTLELARFIHYTAERGDRLSGIVHLTAAETISKYELLERMRRIFDKQDVRIRPDDAVALDRTLRSTRPELDFAVPGHDRMLEELREWMQPVR
ncbi:sugar nucleotide-binding protein [Paenibacillus sp. MZ04-78.2]|nr:sugar nucleotide-binding protein [Paenibacillus sp. MZ04-78.2]